MKRFGSLALGATAVLLVGCTAMMVRNIAQDSAAEVKPPFSGPANVKYASQLWSALEKASLVGPGAVQSTPYEGQEPHGAVLVVLEQNVSVGGHTGVAIVKNNFGGEGVSKETVANDPGKYLASVTVMYQREQGYDPDHQNWFWAKYNPDGTLAANPKGMKLAGRVAKGAQKGCIACHDLAPGDDYIFNHDRLAQK